jgi:hypothetical protein
VFKNEFEMLDPSTFEYLKPTEKQLADMARMRTATALYASMITQIVPGGADRTYVLRKLRTLAMWCNVAISRNPDGKPRKDEEVTDGD